MKDAYYFSHDSNAKDDPKCVLLIEQLGMEGYGIFWVLIETLRDQPEYKYPLALIPALARRYNTTTEKIKTVVMQYGLFEIADEEFFYSDSLNRRMQHLEYKRQIAIKAGKKSAEMRLLNSCSTDVEPTLNECSTSKVKESKVKERKKHSAFSSEIENLFENVWKLYPNKKGKGQISETQKNKLLKVGEEHLKRCIDRYLSDLKKEEWRKPQNGSTFFNSGYVDYLDENYSSTCTETNDYDSWGGIRRL